MKLTIPEVNAHCDVPCGIYETDTMRHAAETCKVMIEKINGLGDLDSPEKLNSFVRMVSTKEVHAERVKHELRVLWGDYFKPEHLEAHPDLHDTVWKALKQASTVKQGVNMTDAETLSTMVAEVADIFADTKK